VRSVLNEWSASANGKELKGGFYPTLGATVEHVDRLWPHIVSSGTGGGTGVAPGSGGGSGGGGSGGQSCAAFGDASAICAPISQISVTPTGSNQALAVSGGQTILTAAMTSLKLAFTSNSGNAGKNLAIQFFDVSPGLGISLQTSEAGSSTTCRAAEAVGNMCFITADSAGSANFTMGVTGVQIGRFFKFQINGPAGFTSGFITATYATSVTGGDTADLCADRTRICASVSRVSFDVAGSRVPVAYDSAGAGSALMPVGTTAATFRYTSAADYAGKFVHIQFFDLTAGLELTVPSGVANSSTSCDPGPAPARGCYLQLDSSGAASFNVALTGVVAERFFRYQISGAGGVISQSVTVTVRNTVVVPCVTAKVLAGSSSVSATTGTSTKVTFTVVDAAGKPCEAKAVSFSATGWGSLGASSAFTDGAGQVSVTVQSDAATTDKSMVVKAGSLNAKKATVSASTTVKWAKVPTPPAATVTTARGLIKVVVTSAAGMTVTISYSGASTGTKSFDVTAKSATLSVAAVKGSYTVTVKIGSYVLVKTVSVS
jgi:Bacterial Ig-like domain (group 1)